MRYAALLFCFVFDIVTVILTLVVRPLVLNTKWLIWSCKSINNYKLSSQGSNNKRILEIVQLLQNN